jgi:cellulose synthase/poly-beta-1,6-N-acetylglucosamine synthase-like glycosyltransferase
MSVLAVLAPSILAWIPLLIVEIVLALPLLYLSLLSIGAIVTATVGRRRTRDHRPPVPAGDLPASTFAILVPAHDEEMLIGDTLASLAHLDYPADRYTVHIIADNCTDRTAEIAGASGVYVHERTDTANRGKGYALAWAFGKLAQMPSRYDAYVVLDADTVVDPYLLQALAKGLARGGKALQSHNAVLNASDSASTALRWLALSLINYIRPMGRNSFGGSSTLTGNGMCLTHEILSRHPWQAFGLSEDYQYYLTLVSSGDRVLFVPDAKVYSVMPTTARQLQSQDIRWETLSPDASSWQRHIAWRLLVDGVRRHNWMRLDAAAELLTPPLSVLAGGTALLLIAGMMAQIAFGVWIPVLIASLLALALLSYVGSAFFLLHPPRQVYRALAFAPIYMMRKLWIYYVLRRLRKHTSTWVRTPRTPSHRKGKEGMPLETP